MRLVIIIFTLACSAFLHSCINNKKIDNHFYLLTGDVDYDISLNYKDNNDYAFIVVRSKVESNVKCGNYIFIIQHPLLNNKVDKSTTNYFIVDVKVDYSDEKLQPQSITKNEFNEKFEEICKQTSRKRYNE
jgi:hypothetical protein